MKSQEIMNRMEEAMKKNGTLTVLMDTKLDVPIKWGTTADMERLMVIYQNAYIEIGLPQAAEEMALMEGVDCVKTVYNLFALTDRLELVS